MSINNEFIVHDKQTYFIQESAPLEKGWKVDLENKTVKGKGNQSRTYTLYTKSSGLFAFLNRLIAKLWSLVNRPTQEGGSKSRVMTRIAVERPNIAMQILNQSGKSPESRFKDFQEQEMSIKALLEQISKMNTMDGYEWGIESLKENIDHLKRESAYFQQVGKPEYSQEVQALVQILQESLSELQTLVIITKEVDEFSQQMANIEHSLVEISAIDHIVDYTWAIRHLEENLAFLNKKDKFFEEHFNFPDYRERIQALANKLEKKVGELQILLIHNQKKFIALDFTLIPLCHSVLNEIRTKQAEGSFTTKASYLEELSNLRHLKIALNRFYQLSEKQGQAAYLEQIEDAVFELDIKIKEFERKIQPQS